MVNTRRQNAKADTNPSKPVFSKEQNDLFIQKDQEYSLYEKGEILNLFVLGLNESSTEADMKQPIVPWLFNFTPDKNIDVDTSKMMVMINEAKEGIKTTLRNNDAIREEEHVRMSEETITLLSDDNSDSETSETSSEPAISSNKASTFPAEHITDNEETPLKKSHAGPWTSKKEVLETIKKLHFKCGGNELYEYLHIAFKMDIFTQI